MIRAGTLIEDVARYLSDFDSTEPEFNHTTWSAMDLRGYLRMSLASLMSARPNDFSKVVEIPMTGTDIVPLPTECDQLLSIVGYRRTDGTLDTTVRSVASSTRPVMARAVCTNASVDPGSLQVEIADAGPRDFVMKPAVTGGTMVVRCVVEPALSDPNAVLELPGKYEAVLFNWMVSYAMGTEAESVALRQRSDEHWKRGSDLLTLSINARKAARQAATQ
jgi:hypothetical protein